MERKRIGNDIKLRWAVFNPDGTPVDFTDKSVKVEIRNDGYAKARYPQEFEISGNLIDLQFTAKEQQSVGVYNLWLEYTYPDPDTEGGIATVTLDNCGAFQLVSKTCELSGINEDPIYLEGIVTGLSYNNLTEENKDEITRRLLESGQFEVDQIIIARAESAAEEAETQALYAKKQGDDAKEAAKETRTAVTNAQTATESANQAAGEAHGNALEAGEAALLANNRAGLAEEKASIAQTAANNANQAASNAAGAASNATTAAEEANTAKQNAETATLNANNAADNATGAATIAEQAAENASESAREADVAKEGATQAAENANNTISSLDTVHSVIAAALVELNEKIKSVNNLLGKSIYGNIQVGELDASILRVQGSDLILTGTAAPSVVPDFTGQIFINTTGKIAYTATGNASVSDWKQQ